MLCCELCVMRVAGGYYTIEQKSKPLRIVALNTNLWLENPGRNVYTRDRDPWESRRSREGVAGVVREPWEVRENRVHDEDPAKQFSWLEEELHKARIAKKTVSQRVPQTHCATSFDS